MALEARIPKEITEYKGKIFFGLTTRQLGYTAVAIGVAVPIFLLTNALFGADTASSLAILLVIPIFAIGFIEIKGYTVGNYLKIVYRHRFTPQRRYYQTTNTITAYIDEQGEGERIYATIRQGQNTKTRPSELTITARKFDRRAVKQTVLNAKREIKSIKKAQKGAKKTRGGYSRVR